MRKIVPSHLLPGRANYLKKMRAIAASRKKWIIKMTKIGSCGSLMVEFSVSDGLLGDCLDKEVTKSRKKWNFAHDNGGKEGLKGLPKCQKIS